MNLFYGPHIEGDTFELDEEESKHAIRVLRLRAGDAVNLVDGQGGWYEAVIENDHPKLCQLKIISHIPNYQPLSYRLHVGISPTKNMDRFEWFLEKSTEIGITEITPLICHRSERKKVNMKRLERILVSAMKQSLKAYKPDLHDSMSLKDFINLDIHGTKGIAHCHATNRRRMTELERSERYTILVGPEGDFTAEEVKIALGANYAPFHLGESRLRTETAGVFICAGLKLRSL